ncbi:MAG: ABC transporter substrate-binding protein [Chloroflexi bacterium]|nr:ABC transporter substrate-binding protein [Chloroflexota bacterium]
MRRVLCLLAVGLVATLVVACQAAIPTPTPAPKQAAPAAATAAPKAAAPTPTTAAKPAPATAPATPTAVAKPAASAEQALYEAAKKEGKVNYYSPSFTDEELALLTGGFKKKYPGIEVAVVKVSSTNTVNRILTEAAAGRLTVDVATAGLSIISPLLERDLLLSFDWASVADIPKESISLNGRFLAAYDSPYGWFYNTRTVAEADVPRKWEDLLLPKWKGQKLGIATVSSVFGFEAMNIQGTWDRQKYELFLDGLKAQQLAMETNQPLLAEKVASGELHMGTSTLGILTSIIEKGAPIKIASLSPTVVLRSGVYTPKGAPNPNAAKLFTAFLASKDGLELWNKTGRGPAAPCDASVPAKMLCDAKIQLVFEDGAEKTKQINELVDLNRKLLGIPTK